MLEKCTAEHEARMEVLHNEMQERRQSDARWRQLQQESNKSVSALFLLMLTGNLFLLLMTDLGS